MQVIIPDEVGTYRRVDSWPPVTTLWRVSGSETFAFSGIHRGLGVGDRRAGTPASAMQAENGGQPWTACRCRGLRGQTLTIS